MENPYVNFRIISVSFTCLNFRSFTMYAQRTFTDLEFEQQENIQTDTALATMSQ